VGDFVLQWQKIKLRGSRIALPLTKNRMPLSSTQIGAIGENLLVNAVMKASDGRLSPFQPVADDDGLDVLFFDKLTGNSVAIQLKCRTVTLYRPGTQDRGNSVHFEVRKATFSEARRAHLVAALFNEDLTQFVATWFMPLSLLPRLARTSAEKWVIRPSKAEASGDRFTPYRYLTADDLVRRMIVVCESRGLHGEPYE
jgi:hypothetical protein